MSEREEIKERIEAEAARLAAEAPRSLIEQALDDGERKDRERKDRERKPKRDKTDEVGWV